MSQEQEIEYEDVQRALALHIWKNDHLREKFLKSPKETIEKELGVKFDESVKVNIVNQEDSNELTFILPYNHHKVAGNELNDEQLELIAGGGIGSVFKSCLVALGGPVMLPIMLSNSKASKDISNFIRK